MAHLSHNGGYQQLVKRLNRFPQGAPPSEALYGILKILFSEREAELVSLLPVRVFNVGSAAGAWQIEPDVARKILDDLCDRALLVDFEINGDIAYCLPPPMAGFFEFSMMRVRSDIDQKTLAELLHGYINLENDFAEALFAQGQTQLGRVFVDEKIITQQARLEVLDYERASHVLRTATHIGLSRCYCRHKMEHLDRACGAPQQVCLTLNHVGRSLIRHGHARAICFQEAKSIVQMAQAHHLVQFGENVREEVSFICNCCKCCCEAMIAARRFAFAQPVHSSPFLPLVDVDKCSGCGLCTRHCPVDVISLQNRRTTANNRSVNIVGLEPDLCLGCGVCARCCPSGAVAMTPRPQRLITPLNTAHRVVMMAVERGHLQHILLNNQVLNNYRALAAFLGAVFRLPPVKRLLAARQLNSRYLGRLLKKAGWQPALQQDAEAS